MKMLERPRWRWASAFYWSLSLHSSLLMMADHFLPGFDLKPDTGVMTVMFAPSPVSPKGATAPAMKIETVLPSPAMPEERPSPPIPEEVPVADEAPPVPNPEEEPSVSEETSETAGDPEGEAKAPAPGPGEVAGPPDDRHQEKRRGVTLTFSVVGPSDPYWDRIVGRLWESVAALSEGGNLESPCREQIRFDLTPNGRINDLSLPRPGSCPADMRGRILAAVNRAAPFPSFPGILGKEIIPVNVEVRYGRL